MSIAIEKELQRHQKLPGNYTWLARIPFLLFALGGMALILTLKWYAYDQILISGIDAYDQILIAGIAIVLIIVYAAMVYWIPRLRIREDQLGDNCYYLGFLYTLISLSWALYKFAQFQKIEEIIANFGLALASTIIGILLRVVINQARRDVLETEQDARMALTESMVNMRVQLNDAVIALRSFCAQMQQITGDAIRDNAERANTALEQAVAKIGDTSNIVLTRIEQAFDEFNENSKKLNQVAAGTVQALEKLIDRLESMEPPSDLISKRLDTVMESAEKAGDLLRERLEADEKAISEAAQRMKDMEERLKSAAGWIASAGSGLGGVAETSKRAVEATEHASKKLIDLTQTMTGAITEQERLIASTRTNAESLNGGLIETQKRMAEQARESLEALFGALRTHNESMAAELDRARRMASSTGNAFADMADAVTARIQELKGMRRLGDAAE